MGTDSLLLSGVGLVGVLCLLVSQHLWRIGLWAPVVVTALGLGALAGMLLLIGAGPDGFLAGLAHVFWGSAIFAGPVAGLLVGLLVGWLRGPLPAGPRQDGGPR